MLGGLAECLPAVHLPEHRGEGVYDRWRRRNRPEAKRIHNQWNENIFIHLFDDMCQ